MFPELGQSLGPGSLLPYSTHRVLVIQPSPRRRTYFPSPSPFHPFLLQNRPLWSTDKVRIDVDFLSPPAAHSELHTHKERFCAFRLTKVSLSCSSFQWRLRLFWQLLIEREMFLFVPKYTQKLWTPAVLKDDSHLPKLLITLICRLRPA